MGTPLSRAAALVLVAALALPAAATPGPSRPAGGAEEDARVVHALNRLTFGPGPGDVERVKARGLDRWIDEQLHPERIPDRALETRLSALPTLGLSSAQILAGYDPPPAVKKEIQARRAALGDDATEDQLRAMRREIAMEYRDTMAGPPRQVVEELQQAKVLRAAFSERQLDEVLVDFWMNHFNVFANKGPDRFLLTAYERDVIRPHAWGRFEDLLRATAESPAMLFYLDNWLSSDPSRTVGEIRRALAEEEGLVPRRARRDAPPGTGRRAGINENYARELMELHTLGVEGGYTQDDVTEVAKCLTGWTISGLRRNDPRFLFLEAAHVRGDKTVLGRRIRNGGIREGEEVLHLLATHPSTARFVSFKLARRFVADEPPQALVDRAAATFLRTGGDIREVVRTIVTSPEFFAPASRQAKIKTPFEFVVSAVRATGAEVESARALSNRIGQMGMPLYLQQPPTGYKDTAEAWVSTSGLLARLNFALDLAAGRVPGVRVPADRLAPDALVPAGLSASTRRTLEAEAGSPLDPARRAGLVLGSPEFQRR